MMKKFQLIGIALALFANSFAKEVGVFIHSKAELGQINALHYCCDIAGFPSVFFTDKDSISAAYFDVILMSGLPTSKFDSIVTNCTSFVADGGFLFADKGALLSGDSALLSLFGLSSVVDSDIHKSIYIDTENYPLEARWLDDEMEKWFQLCREDKTFYDVNELVPDGAAVMATYEDATAAMTENVVGDGRAYGIGPLLKHLLLFPRMNKDLQAQRVYANGFEPGADIIPLLIRGVVETHFDDAAWKYTLPTDADGVVCITHDLDSKTGLERGMYFADYELKADVVAQFNITTRYFSDDLMSDFYTNSDGKGFVNYVLDKGHLVSSHSVGHFSDFGTAGVFEIGDKNVTPETYAPYYYDSIGKTVGGTLYGELLVSKMILEQDGAPNVVSMRSGHLSFPKHLPEVLEDCGYLYSSSFSANDVLTGFPIKLVEGLSSSNPFAEVLEIPMHMSDVYSSDPLSEDNWPEKVDNWIVQAEKYTGNHAPVVLLIHPNREYKLEAERVFIENLPQNIDLLSFEEVGAFWNKRSDFTWTSAVVEDTLILKIADVFFPLDKNMRVMLANGDRFAKIRVEKESGEAVAHNLIPHKRGLLLEFQEAVNKTQFSVCSAGNCIPNATVTIVEETLLDSTTNEIGRLVVRGLGAETYDYVITADGYDDYYGQFTQERKSFVEVEMLLSVGVKGVGEGTLNLYPIPASDELFVETAAIGASEMTVLSMNGNAVKTMQSPSGGRRIDVSELLTGLYMLQVEGEECTLFHKFLIE